MKDFLSTPVDACLFRMTDDTGMFQHGIMDVPDPQKGYTTDDNARALILLSLRYQREQSNKYLLLIRRYLSFLLYAEKDGWFRNFLPFDRHFVEERGSDDCYGRCLWALGSISGASWLPMTIRTVASGLFDSVLPSLGLLKALRAKAYASMGLYERGYQNDKMLLSSLATDLGRAYDVSATSGWQWFEPKLTYCNAMLPLSLLAAYRRTGEDRFLSIGLSSCDFLLQTTTNEKFFQPIGCKGWYEKGKEPALYDQQPVEASETLLLCLFAHLITGKEAYYDIAHKCLNWYLGENIQGIPLVDSLEGGCRDGLCENGVNQNQGAESILSWQLAWFWWRGYLNGEPIR